jgi:hypothetical protein
LFKIIPDDFVSNHGVKSNHLKTTNKKARKKRAYSFGVPKGIRTPVAAVKGQCPRPLDDGDRSSL